MKSHTTEDQKATADDVVIEASSLRKEFGGLVAVDDVDFHVRKNEIRCLIGPNGAGKSTLLKLLTGFHEPTSGHVHYDDKDITDSHSHERAQDGISLMFQKPSTYEELTIEQNLRIPTQLYTDAVHLDEHINQLLKLVELNGKRTVPVANLSHGERQWLEIAMSMGVEPDLLLLDEPTAGMTIDETKKTAELVNNVVDEGVTVLIVEHDINFVRDIADIITVMHNGQIFMEGTVNDVINDEGVKKIYLGKTVEK